MNISKQLPWLSVILLLAVLQVGSQENAPTQTPPRYRMELVSIFEANNQEFIFVIGNTGFKSVASLKKFLSYLPPGSTLEWEPGCMRIGSEPLLSSEQEMKEFKAFCVKRNINFILMPSG
jgi:hypothetical protein